MERFYHSELDAVRSDTILMGRKSIDMVRLAMRALIENDASLVSQVISNDDEVDELNIKVDTEAIKYISLRQPVATDVRLLTVSMKCAREIERISDEAVSIGKHARNIANQGGLNDFCHLSHMADLAVMHLGEALDAFAEESIDKARGLPQRDKEIDDLNRKNYEELNNQILGDVNLSHRAVAAMFISKSLERVGDHASNIAEETVYLLEAVDIRHTDEVKHPE